MCASYGLGGGGYQGELLPNDPDLAPLDERLDWRFDFAPSREFSVPVGRAALTGRRSRNLNPLFRYDESGLALDKGWFKLWVGGRFDPKASTFNARAENLTSRWSAPFKASRGLVPADWFNEKGTDFATASGGVFMIATVWNRVHEPETGALLTTYALVTRPAAGAVAERHDRMPLLLPPELWESWLDPHEPGTRELAEAAVAASAQLSAGVRLLNDPTPPLF